LYRDAGFAPIGRRPKYYEGQDALVLAKSLQPQHCGRQ
jgi:hypothetical protein